MIAPSYSEHQHTAQLYGRAMFAYVLADYFFSLFSAKNHQYSAPRLTAALNRETQKIADSEQRQQLRAIVRQAIAGIHDGKKIDLFLQAWHNARPEDNARWNALAECANSEPVKAELAASARLLDLFATD